MSEPVRTAQRELPSHVLVSIMDLLRDAVLVTDRDGAILYVNDAFTRLTGYSADEAIGETPRLLRSGQQPDAFYARLWQTVLAGKPWHGEVVNRRKDGTLYADDMTIVPITDNGVVTHMVATKRDVDRTLGVIARQSPVGIGHLAVDGRLLFANPKLQELLSRSYVGLLGHGWLGSFDGEVRAQVLQLVHEPSTREMTVSLPRNRIGTIRLARLDPDNDELGVVVSLVDVTEEHRAREKAVARERFAHAIVDGLADPTLVIERIDTIVRANAAWRDLTAELGGDPDSRSLTRALPETCEATPEVLALVAEVRGKPVPGARPGDVATLLAASREVRAATAGGTRWWLVRARVLGDSGNIIVSWTDVTRRKQEELRLVERADHDPLTGLANRHAALRWLDEATRQGPVGILFVDLDGFKHVNDTLGHRAGDELLLTITRRLLAVSRPTDLLARLGGDEFVLLVPGVSEVGDLASLRDRIRDVVEQPAALTDGSATVGVSIGDAIARPGGTLADALDEADQRMYEEKRQRTRERTEETSS